MNQYWNHAEVRTFWKIDLDLEVKRGKTLLELFKLLFTNEMLKRIILYTNNSIKPALEWFSTLPAESSKYPHFWKVDKVDISAFIGLLCLQTAFHVNIGETQEIWTHKSANGIFSATVLFNGFQFIHKFIKFDNKPTCSDCWKSD